LKAIDLAEEKIANATGLTLEQVQALRLSNWTSSPTEILDWMNEISKNQNPKKTKSSKNQKFKITPPQKLKTPKAKS
jgi:hypothetical protein